MVSGRRSAASLPTLENASRLLPIPHHRHEPFLQGVGRLRRPQTQGERLMHTVAIADEILRLLSELFSSQLELFGLVGFQRANDIQPRLILEFLKAHLAVPSGRRRSFSALIPAAS